MMKRGLILMVGATGSGKSTSIAAMINHRNEVSSDHIVTIEDPIEFLHTNKRSIVNQREVGLDTKSFARALRGVMRAAPDVILIGEIRDKETMEAAINLSGTGHLVLSTLHANNSAETLDRIINMFPQDQHKQIFLDLSQYLRAILSQRLVVGKDGKRIAAIEVMLNTPYITELVKKGDVSAIKEAIVASSERGVQSFDVALLNLYKQNRIELEEALAQRRFALQPRSQDQLRLTPFRRRSACPGTNCRRTVRKLWRASRPADRCRRQATRRRALACLTSKGCTTWPMSWPISARSHRCSCVACSPARARRPTTTASSWARVSTTAVRRR